MIWGWHELAFLTGFVTGPRRIACAPDATGWRRFRMAFAAMAWHEFALAATLAALAVLTWGNANPTGLLTFTILFGARISAKLNIFLGVSNLSDDLMPAGIAHLRSYFRARRMNPLFPVSVAGLILVMVWLCVLLVDEPSTGLVAGYGLCLALTALALLEHLLMVLPVRDTLLWRWLLPRRDTPAGGFERAAIAKEELRAGL